MKIFTSPRMLASWLHRGVQFAWYLTCIGLAVLGGMAIFAAPIPGLEGMAFLPPVTILTEPKTDSGFRPVDLPAPVEPLTEPRPDSGFRIATSPTGAFDEASFHVTEGIIIYSPRGWLGWLVVFVPIAIYYVLWLLILDRLTRFTATLRFGLPFVAENGRRLRTIGLAVVGAWGVEVLSNLIVHAYARAHFVLERGSIATGFDANLLMLFVGLMLLVIAEVFRLGTWLQEEQDATV